jgi:hypothetical protein
MSEHVNCQMPGQAHRVKNCRLTTDCSVQGKCLHAAEYAATIAKEQREAVASPSQMMPGTSQERKNTPLCTGALDYFPLALAAVARLSKFGNDKHNPGQPLHWSRGKSSDHADCVARHLVDRGVIDAETGMSHTVEVAWRALALLEEEEEKRLGLPPSRGSR